MGQNQVNDTDDEQRKIDEENGFFFDDGDSEACRNEGCNGIDHMTRFLRNRLIICPCCGEKFSFERSRVSPK